jgi:uncharacterized protein (TIGR02186 family)
MNAARIFEFAHVLIGKPATTRRVKPEGRLFPGCALALLIGLLACAGPAAAERLVSSLSNHQVHITSSFTGEDLVLFGAAEPDSLAALRRRNYDLVVTVAGPRQSMVTRRKERVLGLWVNVESRAFVNPPSYLAVLSNRPVDQIAAPDVLRRLQIGLDNYPLSQRITAGTAEMAVSDPFRSAFLRRKMEQGLYYQQPNAVTFLTATLYRAAIPLPANVPTGTYEVEVRLFSEGTLVARATSALETKKAGLEQFIADAARDHGILYGLATSIMALLTGWFASVLFRRD